MSPGGAVLVLSVTTLLGASACVLPSFEQGQPADGADAASPDDPVAACGRSAELPDRCGACVAEHCCDLAKACDEGTDCGEDLLEPISPVAEFSADYDPLLGCMQRNCDAACQLSWGCVDDYRWPDASDELNVAVRVVDFAAVPDLPLEGVTVQACQAVDPACDVGRVDQATTDAEGMVELQVQPTFDGFFSFSGADYTDSTVTWTEPIYRLTGFTQYQITPASLQALAVITGVHEEATEPFDPKAGHLIFRVQNCLPVRYLSSEELPTAEAASVTVTFEPNDGASQTFYTEEAGGVSVTLEGTSSDGLGGAFEVPDRNVTVHAVDMASDEEVARGTIRIRPGAIGYVYIMPRSK